MDNERRRAEHSNDSEGIVIEALGDQPGFVAISIASLGCGQIVMTHHEAYNLLVKEGMAIVDTSEQDEIAAHT